MDNTVEFLKKIVEENGGIIEGKRLEELGINRTILYIALKEGILKRELHGLYIMSDEELDEYKLLQNISEKIIFSYSTALYLHGISDRVPHVLDVSVPQGYNVSRLKKRNEKVKFHYVKKELLEVGVIKVKTPQGYEVRCYDLERCVCDLIKRKNSVDVQIYSQVLKEYFSKKCNARKIIKYARIFNIEKKVRAYMEVL